MYTRLTYLISFVSALSLVGNVQAQDATWTDAGPDHLWSTPTNWSEFPTPAHWAKVRNGAPGPTIANEGAVADRVHIGYEEESALTVDGGVLTMTEDLLLGKNGGSGTLNMISGTINVGRDLEVGGGNPGVINMTGGTIIVGDDLTIPESAGSTAEVNLNGGTIILDDSDSGGSSLYMEAGGTLNIGGGTLIIKPDKAWKIPGFVDDGFIIGYGGDGTVYADYDVTNPGQTTVYAIHKLNPNPVDGSTVAAGQVELSWTLPDPCTPGQPVSVDVYITDDRDKLLQFDALASIQVVIGSNVTSVAVSTVPNTRYYWAVDTYIGDPCDPIFGPIFSFLAGNAPPIIDAGDDVTTWLSNGSAEVGISGTVEDIDPTTSFWTVVSEPNDPNKPQAVIADPTALNTTITLSALGKYVLQLDAHDGVNPGRPDTMTINVYSDQCAAAQSLPGWQALPGDINLDCIVDQKDLDLLLEQWLNCNGLECPDIDPIDPIVP